MPDLVMGALGSVISMLSKLLQEEYSLQCGVKERITSLRAELQNAQATLHIIDAWGQHNELAQLWARQVREESYDMEDILDTFLVRVQGPPDSPEQQQENYLSRCLDLWKKCLARRKVSSDIVDVMRRLHEATERFGRYNGPVIAAASSSSAAFPPATVSNIDPRLEAVYKTVNVDNLDGINNSRRELISMLQSPQQANTYDIRIKMISVVGVGGLGKTTLAKAVYDMLERDFDCGAFVPVGRNPNLKKVFKDILIGLDRQRYVQFSTAELDERHLIDELRSFLENKRYFIVIDDIWDIQSWRILKHAFVDSTKNSGSKIIITSRNMEVGTEAEEVYNLRPLPYDSSRDLFFKRILGSQGNSVDNQPAADEISDKFIRKCDGIPLAIITMASLLADKPREDWSELYKTIDFACEDNMEAKNTMKILSFSYDDLPSYLRTCLLYLSAFPEDSVIPKDSLVWMWVAEGFVQPQENQGLCLFEIGVGYFNDLINRCMIQAVESDSGDSVIRGCRVHDMVLDFICSVARRENFFIALDNNGQGRTPVPRNAQRRLAHHNRTIQANNDLIDMSKMRSYVALDCVIETWAPVSSFTLLRVLAVEKCTQQSGQPIHVENLGHLLHLRFLSLSGTRIDKIPDEIGALKFLQTLDLWWSGIVELPSSKRLPKQLVCLRISFGFDAPDGQVFSVEGLTSLQELSIDVRNCATTRRSLVIMRALGSLRELRVLNAKLYWDEEIGRDLVNSLSLLHKLKHLNIYCYQYAVWQATELVLPPSLHHLDTENLIFYRLPSCIQPSCLPRLAHLKLRLQNTEEQDLKILGSLPELRFLELHLHSSATICNINDSDVGYFPKLRCFRMGGSSMALFVGNREDNSVSFHMWNGVGSIDMPSVISSQANADCLCNFAAVVPRFMPSLQVLVFAVHDQEIRQRRYCDKLGLEYLPSLQKNLH